MALYLVTGGAGFIGSNLVHTLVQKGQDVRVLDNLFTGRLANIESVRRSVDYIEGDIRDMDTCRKAMQGVRYALHQAAIPSVPRSLKDPIASCQVNIQGTLNLLVAARDEQVERFVFASSSSVYGDTPTLPKTESMTPAPRSPYAVSKLSAEHFCRVFALAYGLKTVCLRYFNVFGPRQDPKSEYAAVIPRFITACLRNTPPTIFGDGQQSRDFTFVEDCVSANLLACEAQVTGGELMNVGSGSRITIAELYETVRRLAGGGPPAQFAPARVGDVKHSQADVALAGTVLGYRPRFTIDGGLEKTVSWYKQKES